MIKKRFMSTWATGAMRIIIFIPTFWMNFGCIRLLQFNRYLFVSNSKRSSFLKHGTYYRFSCITQSIPKFYSIWHTIYHFLIFINRMLCETRLNYFRSFGIYFRYVYANHRISRELHVRHYHWQAFIF